LGVSLTACKRTKGDENLQANDAERGRSTEGTKVSLLVRLATIRNDYTANFPQRMYLKDLAFENALEENPQVALVEENV